MSLDKWNPEEEILLKEWAEQAMISKILHNRSYKKYSKINAKATIPVIILSTLTGTANFAQERVPEDYQHIFVMCIGALNIIAGIITTITQYFRISETTEGHKISSLAWDKFARHIKIQLSKRPANRESAVSLMKYARDEYDRLSEISPDIPEKIVHAFKTTFGNKSSDSSHLVHAINKKYKDNGEMSTDDLVQYINTLSSESGDNLPKLQELSEIQIYTSGEKVEIDSVSERDKIRQQFKSIRSRSPTEEEVKDMLELSKI